jgi:hypothetical protein
MDSKEQWHHRSHSHATLTWTSPADGIRPAARDELRSLTTSDSLRRPNPRPSQPLDYESSELDGEILSEKPTREDSDD